MTGEIEGARACPQDRRASIAVDLGAESCRVTLLQWPGGTPKLTLVHRFPNAPVAQADGLRWPLRAIEAGVDEGMRRCAELAPEGIRSVAIDGWAVDYVRIDVDGKPLAEPYCYRDERTVNAERLLHQKISPARLSELTGVQQLRINTLYQLHADTLRGALTVDRWLNLPEYMLMRWGAPLFAEFTNATHTQMVDLYARNWNREIFEAANVDMDSAPRILPPGTLLGTLEGPLCELPAFRDTELIAPACHDTASAIAGIPATGDDWAYISSGTWSLVGALTQQPINTLAARADNFTNLGAVGGSTCFHKNVNGMWLLKQCIESWSAMGYDWSVDELIEAADQHGAPASLLMVDDPDLLKMGDMPQRINRQRQNRGLPALDESPLQAPAMAALILHSLAARYAEVLARVAHHKGSSLKRLFIVGGGSKNKLLNRLTAETSGLQVICGAAESATIGNLAVQLAVLEGRNPTASQDFAMDVAHWAATLHPLQPS